MGAPRKTEPMFFISSVRFSLPQAKKLREHARAKNMTFSEWVRLACTSQLHWEQLATGMNGASDEEIRAETLSRGGGA